MTGLKNRLLSLFVIFLFLTSANANTLPEISIITCDSGDELYAAFGHTAIRVTDTANNYDIVYNYGTFDFSTRYFYIKFASGRLKYQLSLSTFNDFMLEYVLEGRKVISQPLNLSDREIIHLLQLLEENYKPVNRSYYYDFFRDNCTTRVRDVLASALNADTLLGAQITNQTYRNLIYPYLSEKKWVRAGIDLLLGQPTDVNTTVRQQAFLPNNFMLQLDTTMVNGSSLVSNRKTLFAPQKIQTSKINNLLTPLAFAIVLFLAGIVVFVWELKKKKHLRILDTALFLIIGITGLFLLIMWVFSWHYPVKYNMNILWMNPLLLMLVFLTGKVKRIVLVITGGVYLLFFFTGPFMMQYFNLAFYPLAGLVLGRLISLFIFTKNHQGTASASL